MKLTNDERHDLERASTQQRYGLDRAVVALCRIALREADSPETGANVAGAHARFAELGYRVVELLKQYEALDRRGGERVGIVEGSIRDAALALGFKVGR